MADVKLPPEVEAANRESAARFIRERQNAASGVPIFVDAVVLGCFLDAAYAAGRAAGAQGEREALQPLIEPAEEAHFKARAANALFSAEHWRHGAGRDWPEQPDDDSFNAFENCVHPACVAARRLVAGRET